MSQNILIKKEKNRTFTAIISSESTMCVGIKSEVLQQSLRLVDVLEHKINLQYKKGDSDSIPIDSLIEWEEYKGNTICRTGLAKGTRCINIDELQDDTVYAITNGNIFGELVCFSLTITRKSNKKPITYVNIEVKEE